MARSSLVGGLGGIGFAVVLVKGWQRVNKSRRKTCSTHLPGRPFNCSASRVVVLLLGLAVAVGSIEEEGLRTSLTQFLLGIMCCLTIAYIKAIN